MPMEWPELPAKYYTSAQACSCLDFWYRGHQRPCKHVVELRDALAVVDATNLKWAHENNAVT